MEDTTNKTKKKSTKTTNKGKNKNNYDPKWKTKKEGTTKNTTTKKSAPKKKTTNTKVSKPKKVNIKQDEKKEKVIKEEIEILDVNNKEEKKLKKEEPIEEPIKVKKKVSSKKVDKEKLSKKYNLEKTNNFDLPSKEDLDKIYNYKNEEKTKKEDKDKVSDKDSTPILKKKHYNYLSRICTLVLLILLFLVLCILFVFKAIDYQLGGSLTYSEYTSNDYSVCTDETSVYENKCLEKDLDYIASLVKNINATFNYEALYSKSYTFTSEYYVQAKLKIYDENDSNKIRYTKDDVLISPSKLNASGEVISFSTDVNIDFISYKNIVNNYIKETGVLSSAELEVGLFLKDGDVSRKISYINIPLTEETFMIRSSNLDNQNQVVMSNLKNKKIDPFYLFVSFICVLMDILLLTYLVNFIYMVKYLDNKYNSKLKRILKEYDDIIVNATSEYTIDKDVKVIEVSDFDELLDARNSLEKPIVYERINDIKSKFYVEDDKTVYVYKMKDDGE